MTKLSEIVRITPDRVSNTVANRIVEEVERDPGVYFGQMVARVKAPSGSISSALWRLTQKGKIKQKELDGRKRYYPAAYGVIPTESKPIDHRKLPNGVEAFFRCTEEGCGREFGTKRQLVMHTIRMHSHRKEAEAKAKLGRANLATQTSYGKLSKKFEPVIQAAIAYVETHPGSTVKEVAKALHFDNSYSLAQLMHYSKQFRNEMRAGRNRYWLKANAKPPTQPAAPQLATQEAPPPLEPTIDPIESTVKQFFWERQGDTFTAPKLSEFIAWYKEHKLNG